MPFSYSRAAIGLLGLMSGFAWAQTENRCADAQRALEVIVKEYPEKAIDTLASHVRGNVDCAGPLVASAITASQASDELVAELVTAAVRAAPEKAVVIAESAIVAAPSASDEVAEVVQVILGDCQSIGEDVGISIGRNRERLLVVLEDALRRHGNCACEIVSAAVGAANGSEAVVSQIVEVSVTVKPSLAAEISECAVVAAPKMASAVQVGLDRALKDSRRGPGALPAAAEATYPDSEAQAGAVSAAPTTASVDESPVADSSREGYGKSGTGKGKGKGKDEPAPPVTEDEEEEDWGWDWIHWGNLGGNGGAVYMIVPSGGVIPPGVAPPLSPSDPEFPKKYDPKYDPKDDPKDDLKSDPKK